MRTILIVEDNEEIRSNTVEILQLANYNVIAAPDGKAGVSMAINHQPDLIVCDIMMPELDGYSMLHMLKRNERTQNTPFIFLTAMAERAEVRKGMELGADDYLTKPFNGTELLNAIESRLKRIDLLKTELSAGINGLNRLVSSISGEEALANFMAECTVNSYNKKQVIYSENNNPLRLFYIEKGKVKTYRSNDDGKEFIVSLYNEGDFFGYTALLEATKYAETAEAIEDSEIVMINKKEFEQLINNNNEVMQKVVQLLANNVAEKEQQLLQLAYNSLRKKVATALVTLKNKYKGNSTAPFSISLSRDTLASIAGTAKESLIRTLSDFKAEGLIEIKQGDIILLDEKKLEMMPN